jgi:hypothetical protein
VAPADAASRALPANQWHTLLWPALLACSACLLMLLRVARAGAVCGRLLLLSAGTTGMPLQPRLQPAPLLPLCLRAAAAAAAAAAWGAWRSTCCSQASSERGLRAAAAAAVGAVGAAVCCSASAALPGLAMTAAAAPPPPPERPLSCRVSRL